MEMEKKEKAFDEDQRMEIDAGLQAGLDVSCYAKQEFMAIQMRQIRLGLEASLDVSVYARPEFDWFQMEEIRKGMQDQVAYTLYADPAIPYDRMRQIRKGLKEGIDLSGYVRLDAGILREMRRAARAKVSIVSYIKAGYVEEQLEEIRLALERELPIEPYLNRDFRGVAIREIRLGLEDGIDPAVYVSIDYNWRQMREIRLGLEHRIDVSLYLNSLFSWKQMQELRLGLEDGLDVTPYRSFIYVAADMRRIREELVSGVLEHALAGSVSGEAVPRKSAEGFRIAVFVSSDEMEACIELRCEQGESVTAEEVIKALEKSGVKYGILKEDIRRFVKNRKYNQTLVAAKGKQPVQGKDGWYEFFFATQVNRSPEVLPDGSVDYTHVKWFEQVEQGQKIAFYHAAGFGTAGHTVTGRLLPSQKGKEKSVLTGKGFMCLPDGRTYISCMAGKIELVSENRIEITRMCALGEVTLATGNVDFDGSILIRGDVGRGVVIRATEDVVVQGFVEGAEIHSKGDIFLRRGVDGAGIGIIEAGGRVVGNFMEYATVEAGSDIEANYCLNCNLTAQEWILLHGRKGMLAGGRAKAGKGIKAHNIGNRAKLPTVIMLGIDEDMLRRKNTVEQRIKETNRELAILGNAYCDFQRKYLSEVRNTMDIYIKIENAIYTKELELEHLNRTLQTLEQKIENMEGARAVVEGSLYEGTTIYIDHIRMMAYDVRDVTVRRVRDKIVMQPN